MEEPAPDADHELRIEQLQPLQMDSMCLVFLKRRWLQADLFPGTMISLESDPVNNKDSKDILELWIAGAPLAGTIFIRYSSPG